MPVQTTAEAYSTGSERRRAANPSKTMAHVALPMRRDSTQGVLVAFVRAAACNLPPPCSRGESRSTGRTFARDPGWPCSREPTRGKDPTRDRDLKFAAVQRTTREPPSAGKVCSAGRTFLVAWSWGTPTPKAGEMRGKGLGQASGLWICTDLAGSSPEERGEEVRRALEASSTVVTPAMEGLLLLESTLE